MRRSHVAPWALQDPWGAPWAGAIISGSRLVDITRFVPRCHARPLGALRAAEQELMPTLA
jgi:hypothetical protein